MVEAVPAGRFWLGRLGEELKDEVVLALRRLQPVPWVDIHCHGGREVLAMLLELFDRHGVHVCSWEEWQRHTEKSPLRAEAAIALAHAPTARTSSILLDQYHGALEGALRAVSEAGDGQEAGRLLGELTRYAPVGRRLTRPWRVVVAGAPNVGKSSLVNALAGFQRSVVSETPGTTRDVVTTRLALDGWPVELADTAGLRDGGATLEEQGIGLARAAAESADLCLWLLDASAPPLDPPDDLTAATLIVVNKIDLPPTWEPEAGVLRVSARTGEGIAELWRGLAQRWYGIRRHPGRLYRSPLRFVNRSRRPTRTGRPAAAATLWPGEERFPSRSGRRLTKRQDRRWDDSGSYSHTRTTPGSTSDRRSPGEVRPPAATSCPSLTASCLMALKLGFSRIMSRDVVA